MVAIGICNNTTIVISLHLEFFTRLTFASSGPLGEHKIGLFANYFSEDSKVDQEHRNRAESQPNICYCEKTLILSNVFNEDVMNNFRSISYRAAKPF